MECVEEVLSIFSICNPNRLDKVPCVINAVYRHPSESSMINLIKMAATRFSKQSILLEIKSNTYVVGDLHGNVFDLIRILNNIKSLEQEKVLFLGDYVDRGPNSLEVITLLFALTVKFPNNVFLIRGNHEFSKTNKLYGFYKECTNVYKTGKVWEVFNGAFSWMPIACLINGSILCVHGGLSPRLQKVDDIFKLDRPMRDYENELLSDLTWSDPNPNLNTHTDYERDTNRGNGCQFSYNAFNKFMTENKLTMLIRGHQYATEGIRSQFDDKFYTIFSSSFYNNTHGTCGFIKIDYLMRVIPFYLDPITEVPELDIESSPLLSSSCISQSDSDYIIPNDLIDHTHRVSRPRRQSCLINMNSIKLGPSSPTPGIKLSSSKARSNSKKVLCSSSCCPEKFPNIIKPKLSVGCLPPFMENI